ncbi:MAG: cytidine deaminase [Alphaproteobacteria bacterium]|nr:cytidine deaminase [Alphaproteobacteria bacterium]
MPVDRDLTPEDLALIEAARDAIRARYRENRHHIGCALRTRSGRVHTAVHLDTYVGRASVCAEAIAVGRAMSDGDGDIVSIVSVRHPRPREASQEIPVVSPCGICREMLADFARDSIVIVPVDDGRAVGKVAIRELLPNKYERIVDRPRI